MLPDLSALPPEAQQQIQKIEQQTQQQLAQLQEQVTVEKIDRLLKDQKLRPFVLDIETDSTIEPDQMAERQARAEFSAAIAPVIQQGVAAMQMAPQLGPFVAESLRFVANGFRLDRTMDDAIDKLAEGFEQYQPPPDPKAQGEDPALAQLKVQVEQVKAEAANAKGQADVQIAQLKLQGEQTKAQMGQLEAEKTGVETEKLRAEIMKIMHDMRMEEGQQRLDAQQQQIDVHAQAEDQAMQREQMSHEADMGERQFAAEQKSADREFKAGQQQVAAENKRADKQQALDAKAMKAKPDAS